MDDARLTTDTLVVSLWPESWSDLVIGGLSRPPGRLVQSVASSVGVDELIVANPSRSVVVNAAKRALGRGEPALPAPAGGRASLLKPLESHRRRPTEPDALRRSHLRLDRYIGRRLETLGIVRPPLVTFSPLMAGFCRLEWAGSTVYYARDDWASHPDHRPWQAAHENAYQLIRRRAMPVVAVSASILERIQPEGLSVVLPNGIDESEWVRLPAPPTWVTTLPRPLIVYVGTLDSRLDVGALEAVSRHYSGGSVVLAGPTGPGNRLDRVAQRPNVHLVHLRDRKSLVGLVSAADVCVLPHRRTPLTEAMNPLKLYEYRAAGRPTVATDLPGSRDIDAGIVLYDAADDFVAAVGTALDAGPSDESARLAFIEQNRWRRRHEQLLALLEPPRGERDEAP